jgi:acyl carrier protein
MRHMKVTSNFEQEVIAFVLERTGIQPRKIKPECTLFGYLGVDGADGWEFVEAFGKRFDVDLSAFRADRHFGPEGSSILAPFVFFGRLISWPFTKRRKLAPEEASNLVAIRVSDLIEFANKGKWSI